MRKENERRFCEELAGQLVEIARKEGVELCDATVGVSADLSASARDGEIEEVQNSSSRGAGIRVIKDGRLGFATSAEAPRDETSRRQLVEKAIALAKISTPSENNVVLPSTAGDDIDERFKSLEVWHDSVLDLDVDWASERALDMEKILRAQEGIESTGRDVGATAGWGVFGLATSSGFVGSYGGTYTRAQASGVCSEEDGKKRSGSHWSISRSGEGLESNEALALEAAKKTLEKRGARKGPTGRVPVIFHRDVARGFFASFLSAINGDVVARNASFLKEAMGEQVFARGLSLVDDPNVTGGFSSRPFDGEGQRVQKSILVDDQGVLKTFLLDGRSAKKLGLKPTGHASRGSMSTPSPSSSNVTVLGGKGELSDFIKEIDNGLLVDSLMGSGPSLVTGEYSRGASGFWIENGKIAYPVEEVTIAGEMKSMMMNIDRVGADIDERTSLRAPTLRFHELMVSGL